MPKWSATTRAVVCVLGLATLVGAPVDRGEAADTRRIEITASRYEFTPPRIEVQRGETVELVLRSADTDHGFAIKPYGVKLKVPKGGASVTATFLADKAGRFPFSCSEYCGSGHRRMKGELVVSEAAQ